MADLIIRGATLQGRTVDVLVEGGVIQDVLPHDAARRMEAARVQDAAGLVLLPSLVDVHVHLREPGLEYKETIATGLAAAARGGIGRVCCMANTSPVNDTAAVTSFMLEQARKSHPHGPWLHPIGALTMGLKGQDMAPMAELAEAGCVAFSNDGLPVLDSERFRRAMEYAASVGRMVIDHCEDPFLAPGTGVNESALTARMGLKGQPSVGEAAQVARDVLLAGYLKLPVHIAHVSCREAVELIAWAKAKGVDVTAETCPHYLCYTEEAVRGYNTLAKVSPPLRGEDDRLALIQALNEGVIDFLATDHAPHAMHEKEHPFEEAPNGISWLDTALAKCWELVRTGRLDEGRFVQAASTGPGERFGLGVNRFRPGDPADVVLFDPELSWTVTPEALHSRGKNAICLGETLRGRVVGHYLAGVAVI
ncbi:MAG: dihydroorotase [Desulfovibrio sp.]|nr:dihydroorotase [Desulfovibrio sp.]